MQGREWGQSVAYLLEDGGVELLSTKALGLGPRWDLVQVNLPLRQESDDVSWVGHFFVPAEF